MSRHSPRLKVWRVSSLSADEMGCTISFPSIKIKRNTIYVLSPLLFLTAWYSFFFFLSFFWEVSWRIGFFKVFGASEITLVVIVVGTLICLAWVFLGGDLGVAIGLALAGDFFYCVTFVGAGVLTSKSFFTFYGVPTGVTSSLISSSDSSLDS